MVAGLAHTSNKKWKQKNKIKHNKKANILTENKEMHQQQFLSYLFLFFITCFSYLRFLTFAFRWKQSFLTFLSHPLLSRHDLLSFEHFLFYFTDFINNCTSDYCYYRYNYCHFNDVIIIVVVITISISSFSMVLTFIAQVFIIIFYIFAQIR